MTVPKVDFYLLSDTEPRARLRTACRLAEKVYDQGLRVTLRTGGAAETAEIDDAPSGVEGYARVLEIVGADEAAKTLGRSRWRRYREHGANPESHNL